MEKNQWDNKGFFHKSWECHEALLMGGRSQPSGERSPAALFSGNGRREQKGKKKKFCLGGVPKRRCVTTDDDKSCLHLRQDGYAPAWNVNIVHAGWAFQIGSQNLGCQLILANTRHGLELKFINKNVITSAYSMAKRFYNKTICVPWLPFLSSKVRQGNSFHSLRQASANQNNIWRKRSTEYWCWIEAFPKNDAPIRSWLIKVNVII